MNTRRRPWKGPANDRQLDRAVRMLSQDVPNLFAHRTREDVLANLHLTETQCAENPYREQDVERAI